MDETARERTVEAMSQRQSGFHGGVQDGTTAAGNESFSTEQHLREAACAAAEAGGVHARWVPGLSSFDIQELLGINNEDLEVTGIYPDGGIWLITRDGRPLVAAEAKRQGATGNAIERWFKNYCALKALGVRRYLTVCTGDGFFEQNTSQRTLQLAVALEDPERCTAGEIWNTPRGLLWLYRFKNAQEAGAFDLTSLLTRAIDESLRVQAHTGKVPR